MADDLSENLYEFHFYYYFIILAPCVVPHISHGFVADRASGSSVPHTQTIDVRCLSQFQKTHNSTPVCKNGTWSRIPKCIPGIHTYLINMRSCGFIIGWEFRVGVKNTTKHSIVYMFSRFSTDCQGVYGFIFRVRG